MPDFKPSPQQQSFFQWVEKARGNTILEAVAGSGKTTTIIKAIPLMQVHPVNSDWTRSIIVLAFNKKMADELREKVSGFDRVIAGTFHSQGLYLLREAFGKDLEINQYKCADIFDQKAIEAGWLEGVIAIKDVILSMVSMAKNRAFSEDATLEDWEEIVYQFDLDSGLDTEKYSIIDVIPYAQEILSLSNENTKIIDYDDMIYMPVLFNVHVKYPKDWVLIDEAQDTNPARRRLAEMLLKPKYGRLVAVGDPHQAIFGFTGADNDSLEQIASKFNCTRMPLSVSYRCPKAVIAVAQTVVSHIQAHDDAPVGVVTEVAYDEIMPMLDDRSKDSETAIICRYNRPLVTLCFQLIRKGIPAKIEGRDIGQGLIKLARRWKIKNLIALEDKLISYRDREVTKAMEKKDGAKADRIEDQVETLLVLIERARELSKSTIDELAVIIEDMFADDTKGKDLITLSSVHKSKGLEWDRVFILGRREIMPSPRAEQQWQYEQEINLIYVAVTRAKQQLIDVDMPPKEKRKC